MRRILFMRRILVALAATAALALPASAAAGTSWSGVVVAKDGARKAVVTASAGGKLRTLRAPGRYGSLRVGQRLSVGAAALADGTFHAQRVRVTGRVAKARLSAVLVRYQRGLGRYVVSGGGTVFALRARAVRRTAGAGDQPKPGDRIAADVSISGGTVSTTGVTTTGHASTIELEGIFTGLSGATLQLAVVHRGLVGVAIPAGASLPALVPGDQIELVVSVGADGGFTLVALDGDDRDDDGLEQQEDEEIEVEGKLVSLAPLTVQPEHGSALTCVVPAGISLAGLAVGMAVEIECEQTASGLVLTEIEVEDHDEDVEEQHEDDDHEVDESAEEDDH